MFQQVVHATARKQDEKKKFNMKGVHIIIKGRTEKKLRGAVNTPGQVALQRKTHAPGIEPVRYLPVADALTDEMIDRVFKRNNVILQCPEHETYRGKCQYAAGGNK